MSIELNQKAYKKLIDGDLKWILGQPNTCENNHIQCVLSVAVQRFIEHREMMERLIELEEIWHDIDGILRWKSNGEPLYSEK